MVDDRDFVPPALPASADQKQYLISYMEKRIAFSQGEFDRAQGKEAFRTGMGFSCAVFEWSAPWITEDNCSVAESELFQYFRLKL